MGANGSRFVLYRILGNDLEPRQSAGRTLVNLHFILEHEPPLRLCEKRWVVNRIVDEAAENAILGVLRSTGDPVLHLPFREEEYAKRRFHWSDFPEPDYLRSEAFAALDPIARAHGLAHAYHEKNLYAIHNNGARNAAIRDGRGSARWVLPFDGSCFFRSDDWEDLVAAAEEDTEARHLIVPMARVLDAGDALAPERVPSANEEPQIGFRDDAEDLFDEARRHGRRSKSDLLRRLGVPGHWQRWRHQPWETPDPPVAERPGLCRTTGRVIRLPSGRPENDLPRAIKYRGLARNQGIRRHVDTLDQRIARRTWSAERLSHYDAQTLEEQKKRFESGDAEMRDWVAALRADADRCLADGPYSVLDKTTLAPSGDPHDYWHPAPYWWPDPAKPDGLPYVARDGVRVPGTILYSPESARYDRTRLQLVFDHTAILALAFWFTGEARYAAHAAELLRTWFLRPETRMNPHLEYAQVRRGHNGDRNPARGIIETKDFHALVDAVRLLRRSEAWTAEDDAGMTAWCEAFFAWLRESPQGRVEDRATHNHGTWYDVQLAAIAGFLGRLDVCLEVLNRAEMRIAHQFAPDGSQPHELARSQAFHYCAFNLQGWAHLARLGEAFGLDLWSYEQASCGSLRQGFAWLLRFRDRPWPFAQRDAFDRARLEPLARVGAARFPELAVASRQREAPLRLDPHSGVRPYWALGLPA